MLEAVRAQPLMSGSIQRIYYELCLLEDVLSDKVRFKQLGSYFDADIAFMNDL
jgi:hypothetical protein